MELELRLSQLHPFAHSLEGTYSLWAGVGRAVDLQPNSLGPACLVAQMSSVASTMFYAIWSMFAGFLIMKPAIPWWWRWYWYGCPGMSGMAPMLQRRCHDAELQQ